MVGVEDRNEDVAEEEASGPNSVPDAVALVPAPSGRMVESSLCWRKPLWKLPKWGR
jgi:hypothetical protein